MSELLYRWPPAAKFGRVVPKTKFYEHATLSTALREKFVSEVQRITWAYKLADETIHLRGNAAVPEIQVFSIDAKGDDISDDVLTAVDKAIQFPIIFEVNRGIHESAHTRMVASHKELGARMPRLSEYFTTKWVAAGDQRAALPASLDLPGLYNALLAAMLPVTPRPGEQVSEATDRIGRARRVEREILLLEKKLRAEPQLNRKVELRRELRNRAIVLAELTAPANKNTEESTWTN